MHPYRSWPVESPPLYPEGKSLGLALGVLAAVSFIQLVTAYRYAGAFAVQTAVGRRVLPGQHAGPGETRSSRLIASSRQHGLEHLPELRQAPDALDDVPTTESRALRLVDGAPSGLERGGTQRDAAERSEMQRNRCRP